MLYRIADEAYREVPCTVDRTTLGCTPCGADKPSLP